jgi:hypothetical protein
MPRKTFLVCIVGSIVLFASAGASRACDPPSTGCKKCVWYQGLTWICWPITVQSDTGKCFCSDGGGQCQAWGEVCGNVEPPNAPAPSSEASALNATPTGAVAASVGACVAWKASTFDPLVSFTL